MNKNSLLPTTLLMLLITMGTVALNCPNALAKKKKVCGPKIENDAVEVIPLNDTGYSIVSRQDFAMGELMEPISFYTLEGSMEPISYYTPDNWPKKTDAQVDGLISTSEARGLKILDRKDRVHVRNAKKVFRKSRKLSAKRGCPVVFLGKALKVDTGALIIGRYKYVFTLWFAN